VKKGRARLEFYFVLQCGNIGIEIKEGRRIPIAVTLPARRIALAGARQPGPVLWEGQLFRHQDWLDGISYWNTAHSYR
jgi:hypothetical protein